MKKLGKSVLVILLTLMFFLSACSSGQGEPTIAPTLTITDTPIPKPTNTSTPTFTPEPTSTPTLTATPVPVCKPNESFVGISREDMPEYLDILNVSSTLDGSTLTVVFTVRGIPDEITINSDTLQQGQYEIAWGVAIDTDNNPDTGGSGLLRNSGYGYEYSLQAFNIKYGDEATDTIQNLFQDNNSKVWDYSVDGTSSNVANATFDVDQEAKTITLVADIPDITENSYLHFFTYYDGGQGFILDEVCQR